jgi:hypothetical protein
VSFINQALKGVPKDFHVGLLEKCQAVTKEDVISAFRTHFLPLFDPVTSMAVVVTTPSKVDQIEEGLRSVGFDIEKRTLEVDAEVDGSSESSGSEGE